MADHDNHTLYHYTDIKLMLPNFDLEFIDTLLLLKRIINCHSINWKIMVIHILAIYLIKSVIVCMVNDYSVSTIVESSDTGNILWFCDEWNNTTQW